jgi:hypothetical protein
MGFNSARKGLISVLIIPDVLEDARSVSDQNIVLGTAVKEELCRMKSRRNLGNFKQTKPLLVSWTTGHTSILHYLIRFVGLMILHVNFEVYSCAYPGRAIHVCVLTFGWLLDPKC